MKLNEPETHKLGQKSSRQVKYVSYILTWWWIFPRLREVMGEYSTIDSPPVVFFFFFFTPDSHKKKRGGGTFESFRFAVAGTLICTCGVPRRGTLSTRLRGCFAVFIRDMYRDAAGHLKRLEGCSVVCIHHPYRDARKELVMYSTCGRPIQHCVRTNRTAQHMCTVRYCGWPLIR